MLPRQRNKGKNSNSERKNEELFFKFISKAPGSEASTGSCHSMPGSTQVDDAHSHYFTTENGTVGWKLLQDQVRDHMSMMCNDMRVCDGRVSAPELVGQ